MDKKYFGTDGIRGRVGNSLINPEFVMKLGWAAGRVLGRGPGSKVLIGKDTRISGYLFESALEAGLVAAGVNIRMLGPMPTPGIAYLTRTLRADAGIVISASHNSYEDNGIKFFSGAGTKLGDEMELAIEAEIDKPMTTVVSSTLGRAKRIDDAAGRYIEFCKSTVPSSMTLNGLKIVVDCAHGATYHIAPHVLGELGAEVIAIGDKPDGLNINAGVGSTHPQALQQAVLKHNADLGIALDGDGDRLIMVDDQGGIVDGDAILYVIALSRQQDHGGLTGGVVGTLMSNFGLELACRDLGLEFERTQVGDRYVLERLNEKGWILGGESSGHIICLDRTTTGDGIVSALQVLAAMWQLDSSLRDLAAGMHKLPQVLINVELQQIAASAVMEMESVQQVVAKAEAALADKGRVLLRPSGTEPLIRVMVEGSEAAQVTEFANRIADAVKAVA